MTKFLFIAFGVVCVILGAIGIVLPVLPTTPFLLLAAFLFYRSSPEMYRKLLENKVFGKYISNYFNNEPMPVSQIIISVASIWIGLGLTFYFARLPQWVVVMLAAIGLSVSIYLSTRCKKRIRKKI
ncbi:MAG: YbaN family protein [Tannerella sp.]|jgi:uncharacterized membrane protein YbaN (DUF454 family)|nr:YbaN family protein [Tannerella sp.]